MAIKTFTIIDDTGKKIVDIVADTDASGAAITVFSEYFEPSIVDRISATLCEAAQWLRDNGVL